jgi:hypothetical protein
MSRDHPRLVDDEPRLTIRPTLNLNHAFTVQGVIVMRHVAITRIALVSAVALVFASTAVSAPAVATNPPPTGGAVSNGIAPAPPGTVSHTDPTKAALVKALTPSILAAQNKSNASGSLAAAAVTYHNLSISLQEQQTTYWCAPAASRAVLTAFGVYATQSNLATLMGTTPVGTNMANVPPVLNNFQSENVYDYDTSTDSASQSFARVSVDVEYYEAALEPALQGSYLPLWNKNNLRGTHAIVLYGYGSDGSSISIGDPIDNSKAEGYHTATSTQIYDGMKSVADALVW